MDVATALYASAAVLLVVAGAVKVARPASTVDLLEDLGAPQVDVVPAHRLVWVMGFVEIVVGVAALAVGGLALALFVSAFYVIFALSVVQALSVGASSCGCFGRVEAPPSWIHVAGNAVFAIASAVAAAGRTPLEVMADQPAGGIGFVVLIGVIAGLALVAFTALPEALSARAAVSGRRG